MSHLRTARPRRIWFSPCGPDNAFKKVVNMIPNLTRFERRITVCLVDNTFDRKMWNSHPAATTACVDRLLDSTSQEHKTGTLPRRALTGRTKWLLLSAGPQLVTATSLRREHRQLGEISVQDLDSGWTLFCSGKPVGGPVSPNASRKGASQNRERDHAGCLNGCRREVHQKRRPQTAESLEVLARSKDTAAASLSLSQAMALRPLIWNGSENDRASTAFHGTLHSRVPDQLLTTRADEGTTNSAGASHCRMVATLGHHHLQEQRSSL